MRTIIYASILSMVVAPIGAADRVAVDVTNLNGTYLLTVQGGQVTVEPLRVVVPYGPVVPPVIVPPVVPPVVPSVSLTDVVKAATNAIPSYPAKEDHRRTVAFVLDTLAPTISKGPADKTRPIVKQAVNATLGADASKWSGWWTAVDARLDVTVLVPPDRYEAALHEVARAITADLPAGAPDLSETFGRDTYGLDFAKILAILTALAPYIQQIMELLKFLQIK